MKPIYVSNTRGVPVDHDTANDAALAVEKGGGGSVTKFVLQPNLYGGIQHRCSSLWQLEYGVWTSRYIYDGNGGAVAVERPF